MNISGGEFGRKKIFRPMSAVSLWVHDGYTLEKIKISCVLENFYETVSKTLKTIKKIDTAFDEQGMRLSKEKIQKLKSGSKVWVKSSEDLRTTGLVQSHVRLVVMGPPEVGKSAVTFRYLNDNFIVDHDPTVEDTWSHTKSIDGVSVKVDILDTAGLIDYTTDLGNWIVDKDGIVFVYDITNKLSFQRLKKQREGVYEDFQPADIPSIIVIGNKKDLASEKRDVQRDDVSMQCKEWGVLFEETSAKTDERITESFVALIRQHLKNQYGPIPKQKTKWCTIL